MPRHLVVSHMRAPGDITVLTALIRDIQVSRPGMFLIDVDTTCPELWDNNPYVTRFRQHPPPGTEYYKADYGQGLIQSEFETVHFMAYFHRHFEHTFKIKIPTTLPYPALFLADREKTHASINHPYWVVFPGGKTDFTVKLWGADNWTRLLDRLGAQGIPCVQAGNAHNRHDVQHINPVIASAEMNLVGQTTLRETLQLIYHSDGVICHNSFAMHAAAALQKPCVVLGGGREQWFWAAYCKENKGLGGPAVLEKLKVPHRFLHTIGLLACCKFHGCQKCQTLPLNDGRNFCEKPVMKPGDVRAFCMDMLTPEIVETAVLSYYLDGTIQRLPAGLKRLDNNNDR